MLGKEFLMLLDISAVSNEAMPMTEPRKQVARTKTGAGTASIPPRGVALGRPGVPSYVADRVREMIEQLLLVEPYKGRGGITRLARALGVTQPAVTQIRDGGGVSPETAVAVAGLAGEDARALLEGSYVGVAIKSKHPFLDMTLGYQPNWERWSKPTIAAAREGLWDDDPPPDVWIERLDKLEKTLKVFKGGRA